MQRHAGGCVTPPINDCARELLVRRPTACQTASMRSNAAAFSAAWSSQRWHFFSSCTSSPASCSRCSQSAASHRRDTVESFKSFLFMILLPQTGRPHAGDLQAAIRLYPATYNARAAKSGTCRQPTTAGTRLAPRQARLQKARFHEIRSDSIPGLHYLLLVTVRPWCALLRPY